MIRVQGTLADEAAKGGQLWRGLGWSGAADRNTRRKGLLITQSMGMRLADWDSQVGFPTSNFGVRLPVDLVDWYEGWLL